MTEGVCQRTVVLGSGSDGQLHICGVFVKYRWFKELEGEWWWFVVDGELVL